MTTTIPALAAALLAIAPRLAHHEAIQDASLFVGYARAHNLEPELLAAVAFRESSFHRLAVSTFVNKRTGELGHSLGLMGVRVTTEGATHDLFDAATNVSAGSKLLAAAIKACGGEVERGLTAYWKGRGKHSKNCRPSKYSAEVMDIYSRLVEPTAKDGGR